MKTVAPFDLTKTYAFLEDGGAAPTIEATEAFWRELMSGTPVSADATLVAHGAGWLTALYYVEHDTRGWEMHPAGDELIFLLSGAIDFVFDETGGERVVELREGGSCVVPRGVWHRQIVQVPGRELAITYGRGTQHRPV